jgi:hypothetical protein
MACQAFVLRSPREMVNSRGWCGGWGVELADRFDRKSDEDQK